MFPPLGYLSIPVKRGNGLGSIAWELRLAGPGAGVGRGVWG